VRESDYGTSRPFAVTQQSGRFRSEADMRPTAVICRIEIPQCANATKGSIDLMLDFSFPDTL
jgi:hypothetical protein